MAVPCRCRGYYIANLWHVLQRQNHYIPWSLRPSWPSWRSLGLGQVCPNPSSPGYLCTKVKQFHNINSNGFWKCTTVTLLKKASTVTASKSFHQSLGCRLLVIIILVAAKGAPPPLFSTEHLYLSHHFKRWLIPISPRNSSMRTFCYPA